MWKDFRMHGMSDDRRAKNIRLGLLLAGVAVFFFLYALFKFRLA
jgi:hypothetical protein